MRQAERAGNAPPDELPLALATEGTHGPVIHAANRAAGLAGVTVGARVTDMRALCQPVLNPEDRCRRRTDLRQDKAARRRLGPDFRENLGQGGPGRQRGPCLHGSMYPGHGARNHNPNVPDLFWYSDAPR